jgi:hypothetical protein
VISNEGLDTRRWVSFKGMWGKGFRGRKAEKFKCKFKFKFKCGREAGGEGFRGRAGLAGGDGNDWLPREVVLGMGVVIC